MKYKEITFEELLEKIRSYNPNPDIKSIEKAYEFASKLHKNQILLFKEPNVHLLNIAEIVADLELDDQTLIATLIHHTTREGHITSEEVRKEFGEEVNNIIDEFIKISEIEDKNYGKIPNDVLGKIILATAKDIRSLFIKIAARLESLRSIKLFDEKTAKQFADLALNVYVPICHKLGLFKIGWELEDLSFKVLNPQEYNEIKKKIGLKREERETEVKKMISEISEKIREKNIEFTIYGRPKHFYGIYKKMKKDKVDVSEIHDLFGIRIICDSVADCYEILGILHSKYQNYSEKFNDYIANPKENNYRSIHTVINVREKPVEVQIRTWGMHAEAEDGLAAHWLYKKFKKDRYFDKQLSWTKQIVEWQQKSKNAKEFMKSIKLDFDERKIFVFTPNRDVIVLPEKSTPLDFAFKIHKELGLKTEKAKVNGKIVPLDYSLESGDTVEIIPGKKPRTKKGWLKIVKLNKAVKKIKQSLEMKRQKPSIKSLVFNGAYRTTDDKNLRLAKCCNPLPGDEVIGYRTTKRKITVHRKDCENIIRLNDSQKINIKWTLTKMDYTVQLMVKAKDRSGILRELLDVISSSKVVINSTTAKADSNDILFCQFNLKIKNLKQLNDIIEKISAVDSVYSVERV